MMELSEWIGKLSWEMIPEEVRISAVYKVLDLISCSAGAVNDPLVCRMREAVQKFSGTVKDGGLSAHVFGMEGEYPLSAAVMLNAMLAHTLELDDVHPSSKTHGSASMIPAAWALAETIGASGEEFLTAVVAGYETVARIGMAFGVSEHRSRGWHATATCGVFGTAAACAKLLKLDDRRICSALGLAGSQSTGVWAFLGDGTNSKILNPGRAAVNGLESAFFAEYGMTGPEHILESEDGGLLHAMSDGGDLSKVTAGLGQVWETLKMDMKPYPCCRSAHSAIDCAFELRQQLLEKYGITDDPAVILAEIDKIQIDTYLVGYRQCAVSDGCLDPKTVTDAKFSLPYASAAALLLGKVTTAEFTEKAIRIPEVRSLLKKIRASANEEFTSRYPQHWGARMRITLADGLQLETTVADPAGSVNRPLTKDDIMRKGVHLLEEAYGSKAAEIAGTLLHLADLKRLPVF